MLLPAICGHCQQPCPAAQVARRYAWAVLPYSVTAKHAHCRTQACGGKATWHMTRQTVNLALTHALSCVGDAGYIAGCSALEL
jgi:hypothetical protein